MMMTCHPALDLTLANRLAGMPLGGLLQEYPNKIAHQLESHSDVGPPRGLTPAFYGCFDWHSAVHGHWTLLRLMREFPQAEWREGAMNVLSQTLTVENLRQEVAYRDGRASFECPYGTAWLLLLVQELRVNDPSGGTFLQRIEPLESRVARDHFSYLGKLPRAIRTGEHNQSAFALGLTWDWALARGDRQSLSFIEEHARSWYGLDRAAPVRFEPSGHDFLSPILASADLMRRILDVEAFRKWFDLLLPVNDLDSATADYVDWLKPVTCPDQADGKLAHLDGLNLSRAWMLEGLLSALEESHPLFVRLERAATEQTRAGLEGLQTGHYAGTHWLATFATYLLTRAGFVGQAH